MVELGKCLNEKEIDILKVIKEVYAQQKRMFDNHKHSVSDRIVNLNQPHIRPIVRGKASAKTELVLKLKLGFAEQNLCRIDLKEIQILNDSQSKIAINFYSSSFWLRIIFSWTETLEILYYNRKLMDIKLL